MSNPNYMSPTRKISAVGTADNPSSMRVTPAAANAEGVYFYSMHFATFGSTITIKRFGEDMVQMGSTITFSADEFGYNYHPLTKPDGGLAILGVPGFGIGSAKPVRIRHLSPNGTLGSPVTVFTFTSFNRGFNYLMLANGDIAMMLKDGSSEVTAPLSHYIYSSAGVLSAPVAGDPAVGKMTATYQAYPAGYNSNGPSQSTNGNILFTWQRRMLTGGPPFKRHIYYSVYDSSMNLVAGPIQFSPEETLNAAGIQSFPVGNDFILMYYDFEEGPSNRYQKFSDTGALVGPWYNAQLSGIPIYFHTDGTRWENSYDVYLKKFAPNRNADGGLEMTKVPSQIIPMRDGTLGVLSTDNDMFDTSECDFEIIDPGNDYAPAKVMAIRVG